MRHAWSMMRMLVLLVVGRALLLMRRHRSSFDLLLSGFQFFVDFFSYVRGILSQCLSSLFPSLLIPNLDEIPWIIWILLQKSPGGIQAPYLPHEPRGHVGLLQLPRAWVQVLPLVVLHDGTEHNVARVVVDPPSPAREDVVLVEVGDRPTMSRVDVDAGRGDGSSLGSRHC